MTSAMKMPVDDLMPTRYSLLSRLQNWDDHESWKDFFDTYWRLIYSVAMKSGLTDVESQEVVQETVIYVSKNLHKFKKDPALGSFRGWLRRVTRWRIQDQFEKRKRAAGRGEKVDREMLSLLEEVPDPAGSGMESLWEQEWQANLFATALERVKHRVKEEQFQIFDLYVVKQWPVAKVARMVGVSASQVYVVKHRISALVKKELKALEGHLL
jgi:RNA polymerase sigma factor (sigma-70 family)